MTGITKYIAFGHQFASEHRWFSGRILACHAGGPGSIPGRCNLLGRRRDDIIAILINSDYIY